MDAKQTLLDQREELEQKIGSDHIVARDIAVNAKDFLRSGLVKVITGIRRCGKSTLAYSLFHY